VRKILRVALREFVATAMTKAFIIGAFVVPAVLVVVMLLLFPMLLKREAPTVEGRVAVIDPTGRVTEEIVTRLRPEALAEGRSASAEEVIEQVGDSVGGLPESGVARSVAARVDEPPRLSVVPLDPGADLEAEKELLRRTEEGPDARLALVVVDPDAVVRRPGVADYAAFRLFVRSQLDDRVQSEIREAASRGIRHQRLLAAELDPAAIDALIEVDAPRTIEVTATGERTALGELRQLVSFGFMVVLMVSVVMGGQYLLTTTVEEKSSRVVEVLLSALSPMQLMTGKIMGQLGVGLAILVIYGSIGGGALVLFGLADLLGVLNVVYLIVFFLIAYVTVGAMMAAIGSAVNDLREAQSLQGPVMIAMFIPYMLWFPISRDPNSAFATGISFLPPVSPFVMMLRITSLEPPPTWQVLLAIAVGLLGVYVALWAAAKIFRIGLLMFGKPPNLVTLLRWVREA
jgi:ABC-2 type transport system permease protein